MNPEKDLLITLSFSDALYILGVPATGNDLASKITLKSDSGSTITAKTALIGLNGYSARLVFGKEDLFPKQSYTLSIASGFSNINENALYTSECPYKYVMIDDDCSQHGTYASSLGECVCEKAYAGANCDGCATGYARWLRFH
jgi:hypothetical protein